MILFSNELKKRRRRRRRKKSKSKGNFLEIFKFIRKQIFYTFGFLKNPDRLNDRSLKRFFFQVVPNGGPHLSQDFEMSEMESNI
jgi:hypothetical protein